MTLTPLEEDAIVELVNIGFGKSAAALSALVGQRIDLEAPSIDIIPLSALGAALVRKVHGDVATVHQLFEGALGGSAMLLLDAESAAALLNLLTGGQEQPGRMSASQREALLEVGNILLNAFLGSFGNLLQAHISFTVPRLGLESLGDMVSSLTIDRASLQYVIVIESFFKLAHGGVTGYVLLIIGVKSMEALLQAMRASGILDE